MSREILEAVTALAQEKGIDPDILKSALEDALLSAYKKSPGAAKYARVEFDDGTGDYRVFELILPAELEEKLLEQVAHSIDKEHDSDAIRDASRAKGIAPRSSSVREMLALALYQAGKFREAIRELQAYRRMTGRADQNHLLADAYRAVGEPEKAVPLADEATRAKLPDSVRAEAAVVGGAALADLGRYDEALTLLRRFDRKSTEAHSHDLRVWYVMADVLEKTGRKSEARDRFKKIMQVDPDAYDVAERLSALS